MLDLLILKLGFGRPTCVRRLAASPGIFSVWVLETVAYPSWGVGRMAALDWPGATALLPAQARVSCGEGCRSTGTGLAKGVRRAVHVSPPPVPLGEVHWEFT